MSFFDKFKKKKNDIDEVLEREREREFELYNKEVEEAQEEELHSSRFEFVTVFMNVINSNKHKDKENYLFNVILDKRTDHLGKDFTKVKGDSIAAYDALVKFINHLTPQEIEENYYFYVTKRVLDVAGTDMLIPMMDLMKLIDENSRLTIFKRHYDINSSLRELIPQDVPLTREHSIETDTVYYANSDPILADDYIGLYKEFNGELDKLRYMVTNIYSLVIWKELSSLKEPVGLRSVKVHISDLECVVDLSFGLENNNRVRRSYVIDSRVTRLIGESCGIPFDDMITMDPKVLEKKLEDVQQKRLIRK